MTTWGPRFLEPATTAFWNAVREVRPDLYKGFNPWDRISDPESVRARCYAKVGSNEQTWSPRLTHTRFLLPLLGGRRSWVQGSEERLIS